MLLENFGWMLFGAGIGSIGTVIAVIISDKMALKRFDRFNGYMERVQEAVHEEVTKINEQVKTSRQEISELQFRDRDGVLCKAQIIVDHDLFDMKPPKEIHDWINTHRVAEEQSGRIEQFIFSGGAAAAMSAIGTSPDMIVRQILKEAGRI